jgi:hypothetical protein
MTTTPTERARTRIDRREGVSFARLLWVAPLTVAVALALNVAIKVALQALFPSLRSMMQLGTPLTILTLEGAVAAVVVFALVALLVPRPIFWYRIVATVALLVSLIPDVALAMGGAPMMTAMRAMGPLLSPGAPAPSGPPSASGGGGPPPGAMPAMALEHVLVLMLLHVATFAVCVGLLTTLTRKPVRDDGRSG